MRSHHAWYMLRGMQWDSYWCVHTMHGLCSEGCSGILIVVFTPYMAYAQRDARALTGVFAPCIVYAQRDAVGVFLVRSHHAWYMLRGVQWDS